MFRYHIVFKFLLCIFFRTCDLNVQYFIYQKKSLDDFTTLEKT